MRLRYWVPHVSLVLRDMGFHLVSRNSPITVPRTAPAPHPHPPPRSRISARDNNPATPDFSPAPYRAPTQFSIHQCPPRCKPTPGLDQSPEHTSPAPHLSPATRPTPSQWTHAPCLHAAIPFQDAHASPPARSATPPFPRKPR